MTIQKKCIVNHCCPPCKSDSVLSTYAMLPVVIYCVGELGRVHDEDKESGGSNPKINNKKNGEEILENDIRKQVLI